MIGESGHRHGILRGLIPAGQGESQNSRGVLSVFVEELIKIAHAKQQNSPRMLSLNDLVAFHHGGEFCGHGADVIAALIRDNRAPPNSESLNEGPAELARNPERVRILKNPLTWHALD
uniref:Uncharacterized protein n=1 Tax=uncultured bacterium A1Q1_fos_1877 TaxID=1256555 RepID=L7VXN7_9BACT|nr:hypothetical protein [uncultured bacterium A1Q1_fos_1877]